jgi:hypothetical protein
MSMRRIDRPVRRLAARISLLLTSGLCGAALAPSAARAGAWTLPENVAQVFVIGTGSRADKAFDNGGTAQPTPRYNKFELQALMEYGVTDWLTAIVGPGLQHIDIAAPTAARRTGFGTSEFGMRARLWHGDLPGASWVISGQATMRVPGTYDTGNPAAVGYTGFEADLRALFGVGFALGAWPAFVDLQLAQRFRGDGPPNETRIDATFGVRPAPQWLVLTQSFNVLSQGAGSALFPQTRYHKLQFSLVYNVTPNWSLQGGVFTTFAGRNALQENGLVLGAGYRFQP